MATTQIFANKYPDFSKQENPNSESLRRVLKYGENLNPLKHGINEVFYKNLLSLFNNEDLSKKVIETGFADIDFCKLSRRQMDPIFSELCKTQVFKGIEKIYDVGGGSGNFCEQFFKAYNKTAICLDLAGNETNFLRFNYKYLNTNKVLFESFDMFNDSWEDLENVFLSNIIHDYK